jgi:hypothetical protein
MLTTCTVTYISLSSGQTVKLGEGGSGAFFYTFVENRSSIDTAFACVGNSMLSVVSIIRNCSMLATSRVLALLPIASSHMWPVNVLLNSLLCSREFDDSCVCWDGSSWSEVFFADTWKPNTPQRPS